VVSTWLTGVIRFGELIPLLLPLLPPGFNLLSLFWGEDGLDLLASMSMDLPYLDFLRFCEVEAFHDGTSLFSVLGPPLAELLPLFGGQHRLYLGTGMLPNLLNPLPLLQGQVQIGKQTAAVHFLHWFPLR